MGNVFLNSMSVPLVLALALSGAPDCGPPPAPTSAGNYILPDVISDLAYLKGQTLDAYSPAGKPRPWAVVIHGKQGNERTHITQLFDVLTRAGYAWFSIDYRTPEDVRSALEYIRCPGRFNIQGSPILIGEDTGAALAFGLASSVNARGVVGFGTSIDSLNGGKDEKLAEVPVLLFHGTADEESPTSAAEKFCKQMANCRFVAVPGAIHNFENWHPDQWGWKEELTAWLRGDRRGLWRDIVYSRPGGLELRMNAYIPEGSGPFPAVIVVHGGGWEAGDKVTYVSPVFEPLARAGFAWLSIDYRLTPYVRVPEELDDLRAAIRFVRQHADWFHIDPSRLCLLGESASGHLVTQLVSEPCRECEPQAVISFYGVYDFTAWSNKSDERPMLDRLFGTWNDDMLRRYSPAFHATAKLPPMLIIQGTGDELYGQAKEYTARLKQAQANYQLVLLDGAPHGMENWEGHPEWMFYKSRMVDWLRTTLASPGRAQAQQRQ